MTHRSQFRGVYGVLPTPFSADESIDFASLRRCVEFCIRAGSHGLVVPVNASEFTTLNTAERRRIVEQVTGTVGRQIPVVVGVSAETLDVAVDFASHARATGASAVMAMAPLRNPLPPDAILDYFAAIAAVFEGPVFIQSYHGYPASQLPIELMAHIITTVPGTWYVKEETFPAGQRMTELQASAGDALAGVMGGMGSRYVLDEFARGACGTMPACEVIDAHVTLWEALEDGRAAEAASIHDRLLPLLNFEQLYGPLAYKEVLFRRGVISSVHRRESAGRRLDRFDAAELTRILANLEPLLSDPLTTSSRDRVESRR